MALFLHAGLHLIGVKGYEFLIDAGIEKTQYMADRIAAMPEFELLSEPDINLLLYRYIPESLRELTARNQLTEIDHQQINIFNERLQKVNVKLVVLLSQGQQKQLPVQKRKFQLLHCVPLLLIHLLLKMILMQF